MPTGYTSIIEDGGDFAAFALRCARGIDILCFWRDHDFGSKLPNEFAPGDYHAVELKKGLAELDEAQRITIEEAAVLVQKDFEKAIAQHREAVSRSIALREKYLAIRTETEAWTPPTRLHEGLKAFMLQQINQSIGDDDMVEYYRSNPPKRKSAEQYIEQRVQLALRDVAYHEEEYTKETRRCALATLWVAQLKESLQEKK